MIKITTVAAQRRVAVAKLVSGILLTSILLSCASSGAPPIESREAPPPRRINTHEVQRGETLYSIAWRYETDYREMARINGLSEPFDLSNQQVLKIYNDGRPPPNTSRALIVDRAAVDRSTTVQTAPVSRGTPAVVTRPSAQASRGSSVSAQHSVPDEIDGWQWPIQGRVVDAFGSNEQTKGIVINPGSATEVAAAADGIVVYSGTGIRGVGKLLIIKHSNLYLSAYAYNSVLIAKEGDQVRAGQSIARVGTNAEGNMRVYFEIRKDGQPVDPIRFLPKR